MTGLTRTLAELCARLRFEDLPPEVVAAARDQILDTVACLLAGSVGAEIRRLALGCRRLDADRSAPIWGTDLRASLLGAVTCHGAMAHAWDADDAHKASMGHPGTVVVPVALTFGTALGRSGREMLTATAAGYEAACRVGAGVGIALYAALDALPDLAGRRAPASSRAVTDRPAARPTYRSGSGRRP